MSDGLTSLGLSFPRYGAGIYNHDIGFCRIDDDTAQVDKLCGDEVYFDTVYPAAKVNDGDSRRTRVPCHFLPPLNGRLRGRPFEVRVFVPFC